MAASTRSRSKPGPTSSTDGATRLQVVHAAAARGESHASVEADIAHDLNNLMTTVAGFTGLAMNTLGHDHPVTGDLQQVADAAELAGVLTRRLLALHRPIDDATDDPARSASLDTWAASIVLADDDPAVREFARRALEEAGHHVRTAADGAAALDTAADLASVDLLVTDLDMPNLDGLALADALRDHHPSLAVLFVSGGDAKRLAGRLDTPGVAWLEKPFSGSALVAVVEAMLRGMRSGAAESPPSTTTGSI